MFIHSNDKNIQLIIYSRIKFLSEKDESLFFIIKIIDEETKYNLKEILS